MIKKKPFYIHEILDEVIYYLFKGDGVTATHWVEGKEPITLRSIIERNIDDERVFPQYHALKEENQRLKDEIDRLNKLLEPFQRNKGKGRAKGTFKLSEEEIREVRMLHCAKYSNRAIGRRFKVDEKTIRNILKGLGSS